MSMSQKLLPEFDREMAVTRRLLERVPTERREWRPHPKSFAVGHLAQLLSWMPGWITNALHETSLDLTDAAGYSWEDTEKLVADFDRNVAEARSAIEEATDADYEVPWSLRLGDQVLFTAPRGPTIRTHLSHLIHHRGQLSVYLRLLDIPVPSMYGPTADEGWDQGPEAMKSAGPPEA